MLDQPRGIAISKRDDLFIADTGNRRVSVYSIKGLVLRATLGPFIVEHDAGTVIVKPAVLQRTVPETVSCLPSAGEPATIWVPYDVAVGPTGWVYVADYNNGLIHVFDAHLRWRRAYDGSSATSPALSKPIRIALDKESRLYVVPQGADHIVVLDRDGKFVANIFAPEDARGRFCPAAIAIDDRGDIHITSQYTAGITQFELDDSGCYQCVGCSPALPSGSSDLIFDLQGNPVAVSGKQLVQLPAAAVYEPAGTFVSTALDSRIYRCPWHRVT